MAKNLPGIQETQVQSLGQEDPLEKGMASHSSNFAWRIYKFQGDIILSHISLSLFLRH